MPKSKRNKQIELSKTKKRGLEWKKKLFEEIRSCVDSYENVFVFSVNDMRNSKMKNVREQWKDSRFFIGKNKIMAMALGRFAEEEYKPNLHKIGQRIKGQRALLFSNRSTEDVLSWFRSYSEGDFARSGKTATEDVKLSVGPLPQFPHNLEPYLRQLGLPTSLVKGVIHLVKDHQVCKLGDVLTPETAKILKLLDFEMAEFHITINCMWSQDGSFMRLTEDNDADTKENKKKKKKRKKSISLPDNKHSSPSKKETETEEMEIEDNDVKDDTSDSSASELEEDICNTPKASVEKVEMSDTPMPKLKEDVSNTPIEDAEMSDSSVPECEENIFNTPKAAVEKDEMSDILVSKLEDVGITPIAAGKENEMSDLSVPELGENICNTPKPAVEKDGMSDTLVHKLQEDVCTTPIAAGEEDQMSECEEDICNTSNAAVEKDGMSDTLVHKLQEDVCTTPIAAGEEDQISECQEDICNTSEAAVKKDGMSHTPMHKQEVCITPIETGEEEEISDLCVSKHQDNICSTQKAAVEDNKSNISLTKETDDINFSLANNKITESSVQNDDVIAEEEKYVEPYIETPAKKKKIDEVDDKLVSSLKKCSTPIDNITDSPVQKEKLDYINANEEKGVELSLETPISKSRKVKKVSDVNKKEESVTRQSRPRRRTAASKKVSLPVTPDVANSSQDSPVFRELRNRSVKVDRKRKK